MEDLKDVERKEEELNKKKAELKESMNKIGIEAVFRKEVKKFGRSAHIILPREFLNKKAVILIIDEKRFKMAMPKGE
jgi:putative transposon-encoded protein